MPSSEVVLFTGFPGFIGARLIPRLLELQPDLVVRCLVQERFQELALQSVAALEAGHPERRGRIQCVTGDITAPRIGLTDTDAQALEREAVAVWHLAAVYDLAVSK